VISACRVKFAPFYREVLEAKMLQLGDHERMPQFKGDLHVEKMTLILEPDAVITCTRSVYIFGS
jgi:hypothetical protein